MEVRVPDPQVTARHQVCPLRSTWCCVSDTVHPRGNGSSPLAPPPRTLTPPFEIERGRHLSSHWYVFYFHCSGSRMKRKGQLKVDLPASACVTAVPALSWLSHEDSGAPELDVLFQSGPLTARSIPPCVTASTNPNYPLDLAATRTQTDSHTTQA